MVDIITVTDSADHVPQVSLTGIDRLLSPDISSNSSLLLTFSVLLGSTTARPQQVQQPPGDLRSGLSSLAQGARGTAFLLEEGGAAGLDILDQFSHLLGEAGREISLLIMTTLITYHYHCHRIHQQSTIYEIFR